MVYIVSNILGAPIGGFNPDRARTNTQPLHPGSLILGKSSRIDFDALDRFVERALVFEVNDELLVPDRFA